MTHNMIRRLILGAALGIFGALALGTAAYADDEPQRPGGALGAVVEVVDQVLPDVEPTKAPDPEPSKDPEPEPTKDPEPPTEPEPANEPDHGTDGHEQQADEPTEEPAPVITVPPIEIPVDLPPIVIDLPPVVVDLPPVVVDVPPVVVVTPPIAVTPPVVVPPVVTTPTQQPTTPAPTVDTTTPAQTTTPQTPAVVPAAPLDELPVVIGPTAGTGTLLPGLMREPGAVADQPRTGEPECTGDQPADAAPDHGRSADRTTTDRRTGQPAADQPPAPLGPCPTPTGPGTQVDVYAATAPTTSGHVEPIGDLTGGITWPALDRLHHVRARGDLPASRTTHLEPGPA